ncbi:hypothetical protein ACFPPD_12305 [Cohnella suwonensis]|uniref:Uncharacterized protein n=1 Tax=Cohnella suwonensis TaxID=696072 RepID=A0ABW0LXP5_9BACL
MNLTMEKIFKWLGVLVLLAGITRIGMTPSALVWGTDSTPELLFGFAACILMAASSIGLFLVQRETGAIGFISAMLLVFFNAVTACMVWSLLASGQTGEDLMQDMGANAFIMFTKIMIMIGMFIGTPAFTIATFRAKVFPRWIVYLLLLSMVLPILPGMEKWGALFWGLSYVGMGFVMVTDGYAKQRSHSGGSSAEMMR